jgi:hypothetical protein
MKKLLLPLASLALVAAACGNEADLGAGDDGTAASAISDNGAPVHSHARRDAHTAGGGGGRRSPNMLWHNGAILAANKTQAIFWGPQWSTANFAGDKITGLDQFFGGFGGSHYAGNNDEYTGTNGQVTSSSTYLGHVFDTTNAPNSALTTGSAVAEACKMTNNNPDPNAVYFIYTATGAGNVNYCAWHSFGTCGTNGPPIQVAYMPNIDGLAGCDPGDTTTGHSQGLAALANVTAHELSEAITDPRNGGWYDAGGGENGDKCAWTWSGTVTLSNSTTQQWMLQQLWSNNAYNAGQGSPRGCVQ